MIYGNYMITDEMICSQQLCQTVIEGVQEIIGLEGMHAVAHAQQCFSMKIYPAEKGQDRLANLSAFFSALENVFGRSGGHGLAQRGGRIFFERLSHQPEIHAAFSEMTGEMLPVSARILKGLEILAKSVSTQSGANIHTYEDEQNWYWQVDDYPCCSGKRPEESGGRLFLIGLLQEYTAWITGGRFFDVAEIECPASQTDACLIRINKRAMD